jgi:hypothetical protein
MKKKDRELPDDISRFLCPHDDYEFLGLGGVSGKGEMPKAVFIL